jgi:hypothetical protein
MFSSSRSFLGPVRRSYSGAIVTRQLAAACFSSGSLNSTRASFSASANVDAETSGPAAGAVANAEGVPGGGFGEAAGASGGFAAT